MVCLVYRCNAPLVVLTPCIIDLLFNTGQSCISEHRAFYLRRSRIQVPGPDHPWSWWGRSLRAGGGPIEAQITRLQSRPTRTTLGPEIYREKICRLLKIFALLKFLETDALVDNLNVWPGIRGRLTYVCSLLLFLKKTTAICKYM